VFSTVAQVRTLLEVFPEILERRKKTRWDEDEQEEVDDPDGQYPIQRLLNPLRFNLKAVPFVYIFAQQAIRSSSFREIERGGLLSNNSDGAGVCNTALLRLLRVAGTMHEGDNNHKYLLS